MEVGNEQWGSWAIVVLGNVENGQWGHSALAEIQHFHIPHLQVQAALHGMNLF